MPHRDSPISFQSTRRSAFHRYGVAIGLAVLAWVTREALRPVVGGGGEAPFVLFLSAVMATGWYAGFWPAMLTTALCAVIVDYRFQWPMDTFYMSHNDAVRLFFFILEAGFTSLLCGWLHAARYRAELSAAEARELERTVEQIAEAEQRRIGQDLHDGLGQHLTGVAFLSKALQQKLAGENRPEASEAATINQLVNESIRWTRDLARGLAPMDLDRTSLPESLKDLARKTSAMFNVECTYEGLETFHLPNDETALNLYRVAQEAVSNAVKHGKARHVTIDFCLDGGLSLTIHDDGVGFDLNKVLAGPKPTGMGLLVMRYRAGVIGGKLDIRPTKDRGTVVACELPLNNHASWRETRPASGRSSGTTPRPSNAAGLRSSLKQETSL